MAKRISPQYAPLQTGSQERIHPTDIETAPQEEIAALAYELWLDRGCPLGSPEEDWLRAEQELNNRRTRDVHAEVGSAGD